MKEALIDGLFNFLFCNLTALAYEMSLNWDKKVFQ